MTEYIVISQAQMDLWVKDLSEISTDVEVNPTHPDLNKMVKKELNRISSEMDQTGGELKEVLESLFRQVDNAIFDAGFEMEVD